MNERYNPIERSAGTLRSAAIAATLALGALAAVPASAASFTFNFNTAATGPSLADAGTPTSGGTNNINFTNANTAVQNYMNAVLGAAGSVVTTNAFGDKDYNGENYVVGPNGVARTLGTTDGGIDHAAPNDVFLVNNGSSDRITMAFSNLSITQITFDFEIFPNGSCANGNTCGTGNYPDISVAAGTNAGNATQRWQVFGVMPGTAPITDLYSPVSIVQDCKPGAGFLPCTEKAPQLLGTQTITFATPVTYLEFRDWPTMIGIDNLVITTSGPNTIPAPEPGTLALLGTALLGFGALRRRKAA